MVERASGAEETVFEGPWEDLSARELDLRGRRVRLVVLPSGQDVDTTHTLADLLADYVGGAHGGGEAWSERTGERFAEGLAGKRQDGRQ
jgi:hypothetical protein